MCSYSEIYSVLAYDVEINRLFFYFLGEAPINLELR